MPSDEQLGLVATKIRYVQIAATAMVLVVCFLTPVMLQISNWKFSSASPKMLTIIAGFASLMLFSMSFSIPKIFSGSPAPGLTGKAAIDSAFGMFTTETFIQFALLEGAALMNLIVYSVDHHIASLVVVVITVILMLIFFPRSGRANSAINKKLGSRQ